MGRRAKGEGSVYQRRDGSWVAQFNGTYRYAQTEQAAKQKLYAMLAGAEAARPENISVAKHLDDYLQHAQTNLKPRTVKRYREAIDAHLKPSFGNCKLHNLDAQAIEQVYAKKLQAGLSPGLGIGLDPVWWTPESLEAKPPRRESTCPRVPGFVTQRSSRLRLSS
jgi:integrase